MSNGSLSVDEKTAILIKSYELEPLPKLALEIGEGPTRDILNSGQYLGHLVRRRNLYWLNIDQEVELMDKETARAIRDDPVYGFSHYIVDRGVANVFGKQIFEGKMPLEPAIGAASAIGIVEKDRQSGKTSVYTKKQLGIETKSVRDIAKKFHSGDVEDNRVSDMKDVDNKDKQVKENYEYAREMILKKKEEEEKRLLEEDMDPSWIKSDKEVLLEQEWKKERTPELKGDREAGEPLWARRTTIDVKPRRILDEEEFYEEDEEMPFIAEPDLYEEPEEDDYLVPFDNDIDHYDDGEEEEEDDDEDYFVPFDTKKNKDDEEDDMILPF